MTNYYQVEINNVWENTLLPVIDAMSEHALAAPFNKQTFDRYDMLQDIYYSSVYRAYGEVNHDTRMGNQDWIQEAI